MPQRELRWTPFIYFFYRDINRFWKVRVQTLLAPFINQALYLIIFGVSVGRMVTVSERFSYLHFIIPGLAAMALINNSFQNGSSSIFVMKITGEIIDIKSTALNIQQIIFAVALSGLLRGVIVSLMTLALGEALYFFFEGGLIPIRHPGMLCVFLLLGGVTFSMLGFVVGMWSKTFDHIGAIGSFVIQPLTYLGGVFYDLDTLPVFWQKLSLFNPLLYFVDGARWCVMGVSDIPIAKALIMIFVSLFGFYGLAVWSARTGTFQRAY